MPQIVQVSSTGHVHHHLGSINFQNNPLNRLIFNSYAKESGNEDYSLWDISVGGGGRGSRSRGKKETMEVREEKRETG